MSGPLDHLIPKPKLGRSRVQNVVSEKMPSVSRALLNDIINKKASYETHPKQVNQIIFHLCLAYGELRDVERRLGRLLRLTSGKDQATIIKKRTQVGKVLEGFPLRII